MQNAHLCGPPYFFFGSALATPLLILELPLPTTGTEVLVQGTIIKATQVSVARDCQEPISCETWSFTSRKVVPSFKMFTSASGDTVGDSNTQFGFHNVVGWTLRVLSSADKRTLKTTKSRLFLKESV